jgi:hypothetical protein
MPAVVLPCQDDGNWCNGEEFCADGIHVSSKYKLILEGKCQRTGSPCTGECNICNSANQTCECPEEEPVTTSLDVNLSMSSSSEEWEIQESSFPLPWNWIGVAGGALFVICIATIITATACKLKRKKKDPEDNPELGIPMTDMSSWKELKNIEIMERLGGGNFGTVFRGVCIGLEYLTYS